MYPYKSTHVYTEYPFIMSIEAYFYIIYEYSKYCANTQRSKYYKNLYNFNSRNDFPSKANIYVYQIQAFHIIY